jgi:translation elongation factor EF-4
MSGDSFNSMRSAIEKLSINDSSVSVTNDRSPALGHGYRIGFLGLLHMEVFTERLESEFKQDVIVTAPNLPFKVKLNNEKLIKQFKTDEITVLNPCEVSLLFENYVVLY